MMSGWTRRAFAGISLTVAPKDLPSEVQGSIYLLNCVMPTAAGAVWAAADTEAGAPMTLRRMSTVTK
jgi:hypothetical protein